MIDASEFLDILNEDEDDNSKIKQIYKLGTIDYAYTDGLTKIIFNGETEPSLKEYDRLSSYYPSPGDKVLLLKVANTYVVLGKIGEDKSIDEDELIKHDINAENIEITDTATIEKAIIKELEVDTIKDSTSIKTSTLNATRISATNLNITNNFESENANIRQGTFSNLTVNNRLNAKNFDLQYLTVSQEFKHNGKIGFYGKTPMWKKSVSKINNSNPNLSELKDKLNEIIGAFEDYGLF